MRSASVIPLSAPEHFLGRELPRPLRSRNPRPRDLSRRPTGASTPTSPTACARPTRRRRRCSTRCRRRRMGTARGCWTCTREVRRAHPADPPRRRQGVRPAATGVARPPARPESRPPAGRDHGARDAAVLRARDRQGRRRVHSSSSATLRRPNASTTRAPVSSRAVADGRRQAVGRAMPSGGSSSSRSCSPASLA